MNKGNNEEPQFIQTLVDKVTATTDGTSMQMHPHLGGPNTQMFMCTTVHVHTSAHVYVYLYACARTHTTHIRIHYIGEYLRSQ